MYFNGKVQMILMVKLAILGANPIIRSAGIVSIYEFCLPLSLLAHS